MTLQLMATVLEQLDLALEHLGKGNTHYTRFALMLIDNAAELVLHQIAIEELRMVKSDPYVEERYPHMLALEGAQGRDFQKKLDFAVINEAVTKTDAAAIAYLHDVRNEVYHLGIKQESLLPTLVPYYFALTCGFLQNYSPVSCYWPSGQPMPERARKYLSGPDWAPGEAEQFREACRSMSAQCGFDPDALIAALADRMDEIVHDIDVCIDLIAEAGTDGPKRSRDQAIVDGQIWLLACSAEGSKMMAEMKFEGSRFEFVDWLRDNHPLSLKRDPIPSWKGRAKHLRKRADPLEALRDFTNFIKSTGKQRALLEQAAVGIELAVDMAIGHIRAFS